MSGLPRDTPSDTIPCLPRAPEQRGEPTQMERRYPILLGLCLLAGLLAQVAILSQAWSLDPLARLPENDALVYWDWAREIAGGRWVARTPFLSAPLYPYLLGIVRALGGGLQAVFGLQVVMQLATAALLASLARRHFGAGVALIAALLWLAALEPAFYTGRVLNCSLQLLLTAWTMERWSALTRSRTLARELSLGLALGLTTLAHPPLIVVLPLVALALWRWLGAGPGAGARVLATAALTILPATLHNWAACGELIPISAQAGVTFSHGNNPQATGTYAAAQGVSSSRTQQNLDALDRARAQLGPEAGWRDTDRYFFSQGLRWWGAEPLRAARVAGRKLWYFLSASHYGDIYVPALERDDGLLSRLWLAPLRSAWILWPGCVGLLVLLRRERRAFAGPAVLALIPLLVVLLFWYSPRYRLPALPPLVLAAAWLLHQLWAARARGGLALAAAASLVAAALVTPLNESLGFDSRAELEPAFEYQLGSLFLREDDFEHARLHLARARELGHPQAAIALADLARRSEGAQAALDELRAAWRAAPSDLYAMRSLATALAESAHASGQAAPLAEAQELFEAVVERDPNDWRAVMGLANVLLAGGQAEAALARYERAAALAPGEFEVHFNRGVALAASGRGREAIDSFAAALALQPASVSVRLQLVGALVAAGRHAEAIRALREGLGLAPAQPQMTQALAFHLASAPDAADRDGREALALMQGFASDDEMMRAVRLEALALAQAETGDFESAQAGTRAAAELLEALGQSEWAAELRSRLELFAAGRPFRQAR